MSIWKLKNTSRGPVTSNWKPKGAGSPTFTCTFIDPPPDGQGAVAAGPDGMLRVKIETAAAYERRRGTGIVAYPGRGITDLRITLRRGAHVWMQHAGWVRLDPMMALRHASLPIDRIEHVHEEVFDTWSMVVDAEMRAAELGAGPILITIYLEGHPTQRGRAEYAGTFSNTITIDGKAPQTFVDEVVTNDRSFSIAGRATDDHEVKHVLLTVTDDVTGRTLDSFGRWSERRVPIEVPVEESGDWSWSTPELLDAGSNQYSVVAQAEDTARRDLSRDNKQGRSNLDLSPVRFEVDL